LFALGYAIYDNAVNGVVGATGISSNGIFTVGNNIFSNINTYDFYPITGSALINAGGNPPRQLVTAYDFNGGLRSKTKPTVGAYVS
jgi:hypothetical protein